MPTEQLIFVVLVLAVANVVLAAVMLFAPLRHAFRARPNGGPRRPEPEEVALHAAAGDAATPQGGRGFTDGVYDRVIRIVSYAFLGGTLAIVALSGLYQETAAAIYVLVGIAAVFVIAVHDIIPGSVFGAGKFIVEGSAAIAFVTVLVSLTGGVDSPFVFGYYLVVAGAALVVRGPGTFLIAAAISLVYVVAVAGLPGADRLGFEQLARLAFNVLAVWLLAYLASVVAREQRRTRDAALRASLSDPLTKLNNRSYFFAAMEQEIQRADRTSRRFCLVMLDLDGLKPINDTLGHHYGDQMLREVADVIRSSIRAIDSAARYGGDEFVVLLPETDPTGGYIVAEKLRQTVNELRVVSDGRQMRTTVSVGVVAYPDDGTTADELMMAADAAMYEAKRRGKNRVVRHATRARQRARRGEGGAAGTRVEPLPQPVEREARRPAARPAGRTPAPPARATVPAEAEAEPQRPARRRPPRVPPAGAPPAPAPADTPPPDSRPRSQRRFQVVPQEEEELRVSRIVGRLVGGGATEPPRPVGSMPPADRENRPA